MEKGHGYYIYGKGPNAGWMGVLYGPFKTEATAIKRAKRMKAPCWNDDELDICWSEGEDI